jgi:hypothetical protein
MVLWTDPDLVCRESRWRYYIGNSIGRQPVWVFSVFAPRVGCVSFDRRPGKLSGGGEVNEGSVQRSRKKERRVPKGAKGKVTVGRICGTWTCVDMTVVVTSLILPGLARPWKGDFRKRVAPVGWDFVPRPEERVPVERCAEGDRRIQSKHTEVI